jgi:spore germination protein YaaH
VTRLRRAADAVPTARRRAIALVVLVLSIAVASEGLVFAGAAAGASTTATEPSGPTAASTVPTIRTSSATQAEPAVSAPTSVASSGALYKAAGEARPGIQYEEAIAHERDRIAFAPGDRVTVPFVPRSGDKWSVGGKLPRELPAGQATGRAMAASPQGSRWASPDEQDTESQAPDPTAAALPVDAPLLDATDVQPATTVSAAAPSTDVASSPQNAGLLRQVFGFLPYWEVKSATLNYDVLSTIAYFSVGSDANGNLLKRNADGTLTTGWGGWTSAEMTSIINRAHQKRTRVVLTISVFAWTTAQADKQRALLGNPTARLNLARQAAAAVRDRGADGINLDFEPIASGYADEFTAFVRTVRSELNRIRTGYQLTFDTTGWISNYPVEAATAAGAADAIFIMGYDYRTGGSNPVGSISPLTGPIYDLTDTVRAYLARVPASKLIVGVPYYGRAWSTSTNQLHATNTSGTKFGASTPVVYDTAVDYATRYGRRWDSIEQSPWIAYQRENCTATYGCVTSWRQIYYDDATSLGAKYDLINRYALRGAGIWALGYDGARPELNAALARKFLHDTTAPLAGIRNLVARQRDLGFTVSWIGQDISGIRSYDVQYAKDGGIWTGWLTATTKTSEVFLGQPDHGYAFRVRAIDGKGNVSRWNVGSKWISTPAPGVGQFGLVQTNNLNARTAPDTSAAIAGTLNSGDMVAIVGGPAMADGYTWWQVTAVVDEWQPVSPVDVGIWIAAGPASTPWLLPAHAPNSVIVDPVIRDLAIGDASRAFSPNGDAVRDTIRIGWTNAQTLDTLALNVYRTDGTLAGTITLGNLGSGAQAWDWDGTIGGTRLPDGRYMLALRGTSGGVAYNAPSATPVTAAQLAAYGVTIDTVAPVAAVPKGAIAASRYVITRTAARMRVGWPVATDGASAIAGYELEAARDAGPWQPIASGAGTSAITWADFGRLYQYRVRARDAAGNVSDWRASTPLTLTPTDDRSAAIRYSTGWQRLFSVPSYAGTLRRTIARGATAAFTASGRQFAFVARVGPTQGSASIYVNGVYQGRVSLYSATVGYMRVVWSKDFGTSARRTLVIRALGTAGHPAVIIDALIVAR